MNILELSEQEIIRRNNLNELRAMGIDPYPAAAYPTNAFSTDIKAEFEDKEETPVVAPVKKDENNNDDFDDNDFSENETDEIDFDNSEEIESELK